MVPYQKMYVHLFNAITDALEELRSQNDDQAKAILMKAQQWAEELYIESGMDEQA